MNVCLGYIGSNVKVWAVVLKYIYFVNIRERRKSLQREERNCFGGQERKRS